MRTLLLCALCLGAGCGGDPADAFVGSYTLIGASGTQTLNGKTSTWGQTAPAGAKLAITRDAMQLAGAHTLVDITLGGKQFIKALVLDPATFETLFGIADVPNDGTCAWSVAWRDGEGTRNGTLQGNVLQVVMTADVDGFCSPSPDQHGTANETLQATKDK